MQPIVYCLMGATATGKTALAVELVKRFPFEIISVDSAMIYRGMDIGTAKPSADILAVAPHRLIDIRDPQENYSAAQFMQDALREINDIFSQGKIPLLVGGTMLYFHALQRGLSVLPAANPAIRAELDGKAEQLGWPALHRELAAVDTVAASRIHPHDSQRIQRALEVFLSTGKNITTWQQEEKNALQYRSVNVALEPPERSILHARIAERFMQMLTQGFVAEVEKLFLRGDLSINMSSIRSVGYRQVWQYLAGDLTYEDMQERGIIATRQFAKRQCTWLRSWPELHWFNSEDKQLLSRVAEFISG